MSFPKPVRLSNEEHALVMVRYWFNRNWYWARAYDSADFASPEFIEAYEQADVTRDQFERSLKHLLDAVRCHHRPL